MVCDEEGSSVINPQVPVDLVIDHSVVVDKFGNETAFRRMLGSKLSVIMSGMLFEVESTSIFWVESRAARDRDLPPRNLYLAQVVCDRDGNLVPDTVVGTDSHTTMVNGLGVLGWGVGGIGAEAAMLGQPISMNIPK